MESCAATQAKVIAAKAAHELTFKPDHQLRLVETWRINEMFGLLGGDVKRVRRLRNEFEDIRQRVLYKMNGFEQYSFGSAYETIMRDFEEAFNSIPENDTANWMALEMAIHRHHKKVVQAANSLSGIAREGAIAGTDVLALLSSRAAANVFDIAEAKTLRTDIAKFEEKIATFMDQRQNNDDMIPLD